MLNPHFMVVWDVKVAHPDCSPFAVFIVNVVG
jgi:hypothetical protein